MSTLVVVIAIIAIALSACVMGLVLGGRKAS